jgi:hypothetical protein
VAGREGVSLALETKFGPGGRKLLTKIGQITELAELRRLTKIIRTAKTIDNVIRRLN